MRRDVAHRRDTAQISSTEFTASSSTAGDPISAKRWLIWGTNAAISNSASIASST